MTNLILDGANKCCPDCGDKKLISIIDKIDISELSIYGLGNKKNKTNDIFVTSTCLCCGFKFKYTLNYVKLKSDKVYTEKIKELNTQVSHLNTEILILKQSSESLENRANKYYKLIPWYRNK